MFKSTFISIGLHVFFIIFAYYGLPSFKIKEPIESPIDIVEDTPISSKTSLKLGETKVKDIAIRGDLCFDFCFDCFSVKRHD